MSLIQMHSTPITVGMQHAPRTLDRRRWFRVERSYRSNSLVSASYSIKNSNSGVLSIFKFRFKSKFKFFGGQKTIPIKFKFSCILIDMADASSRNKTPEKNSELFRRSYVRIMKQIQI